MKKYLLLPLLFSSQLFSQVDPLNPAFNNADRIPTEIPKNLRMTFILPINWVTPKKCNLKVLSPEGFVPIQSLSSWAYENVVNLEYIPEGEDPFGWTEIITISKLINKGISVDQLIPRLKEGLLAGGKNGKVWLEPKIQKEALYSFGTVGVSYDIETKVEPYDIPGKREVFGCRYYSGPYDCAGIQYTIRLKEGQKEADAIKKIEHFFDTHTSVVFSEPKESSEMKKSTETSSIKNFAIAPQGTVVKK